jgi:hypothetical protein
MGKLASDAAAGTSTVLKIYNIFRLGRLKMFLLWLDTVVMWEYFEHYGRNVNTHQNLKLIHTFLKVCALWTNTCFALSHRKDSCVSDSKFMWRGIMPRMRSVEGSFTEN